MLNCLVDTESFSDSLDLDGEVFHMHGYSALHKKSGRTVIGASAGLGPVHRIKAEYELFERALTLEATCASDVLWESFDFCGNKICEVHSSDLFPVTSDKWVYSISNGIALGEEFRDAAERAAFELVERDIILRSWFCNFSPQNLNLADYSFAGLETIQNHYACTLALHGSVRTNQAAISVCSFTGIPFQQEKPALIGYGAGKSITDAAGRSFAEFCQRMTFLWDEQLSSDLTITQPGADLHQNWTMTKEGKEKITRWIQGRHIHILENEWLELQYVPLHRQDGLWVVKAISHEALPLTFGNYNPLTKEKRVGLHPIS